MFFTVSGGAYGLEDVVGSSGAGMALLPIIATPLLWSLPHSLDGDRARNRDAR
jgi:hypothetical protein